MSNEIVPVRMPVVFPTSIIIRLNDGTEQVFGVRPPKLSHQGKPNCSFSGKLELANGDRFQAGCNFTLIG